MLYQNYVSFYPAVAKAGEAHNNYRHTSLTRSGVSAEITVPGVGLIVTDRYDHTRLVVENPTAVNAVSGAQLVLNRYDAVHYGINYRNNFIGSNTTQTRVEFEAGHQLRLTAHGCDYVIVEKAIDPTLPVYLRVANPTGFEGIGFFTDTADGADTVLIEGANWYGGDVLAYQQNLDPNITQQFEAERCGLINGYSVAPLEIVHRATVA